MPSLFVKIFKTSQPYEPIQRAMQVYTQKKQTHDMLWLLEHEKIYTLGQAGQTRHILNPNNIPVYRSDRGGQVTYHGPGQLMAYTLFDLKALGIGIRQMVIKLEQSIIDLLQTLNIEAHGRREAPGVYVGDDKIASIGLRVRHGRCYHGLSLNVRMDKTPFQHINPCGYLGLKMVQCADFVPNIEPNQIQKPLINSIASTFGYNEINILEE